MAATVQETEARWAKATVYAAHLFAAGVHSSSVSLIEWERWRDLGKAIGFNTPSDTTVSVIAAILSAFEAARARMERESGTQAVDLSNL